MEEIHEEYNLLGNRMSTLEQDVSALKSELSSNTRFLERISDAVDRLGSKVAAKSTTDWNALIACLGLTVTIVGGLGYMAITPIQRTLVSHEMQMLRNEETFRQHEQMDGHPTAITKFKALEKSYDEVRKDIQDQVRDLDTALQREMRDLDAGQKMEVSQRLDALDKLLQMEIKGVQDQLDIYAQEVVLSREKRAEFGKETAALAEQVKNLEQMLKWGAGSDARRPK